MDRPLNCGYNSKFMAFFVEIEKTISEIEIQTFILFLRNSRKNVYNFLTTKKIQLINNKNNSGT